MLNKMMIVMLTSLHAFSIQAATQVESPSAITIQTKEGNFTLKNLLDACPDIANSQSKPFHPGINGTEIKIEGKDGKKHNYRVQYFSYEHTTLEQTDTSPTFKEYVDKNHLSEMKSISIDPFPTIHFENFDFRRTNLGDGVYFNIAVRLIDEEVNKRPMMK